MKLNAIQLAGLRAYAAVAVRDNPLEVVEDKAMAPVAANAYALGKVDGKAELARELLQELRDRAEEDPLVMAVIALYAHRWTCKDLTEEEQRDLWTDLRDASGIPPGTFTALERMPVPQEPIELEAPCVRQERPGACHCRNCQWWPT
jgi:hypothetical protein